MYVSLVLFDFVVELADSMAGENFRKLLQKSC